MNPPAFVGTKYYLIILNTSLNAFGEMCSYVVAAAGTVAGRIAALAIHPFYPYHIPHTPPPRTPPPSAFLTRPHVRDHRLQGSASGGDLPMTHDVTFSFVIFPRSGKNAISGSANWKRFRLLREIIENCNTFPLDYIVSRNSIVRKSIVELGGNGFFHFILFYTTCPKNVRIC